MLEKVVKNAVWKNVVNAKKRVKEKNTTRRRPRGRHINISGCVVAENQTPNLLEKSPTLNCWAIVSFVLK